jgi:cyclopropane fatty-acyl-phospholipid synthase-like methyltransferase
MQRDVRRHAANHMTYIGHNSMICLQLVWPCREIPAETGSFDKVVSCEMIEAVGQEHLVTYFTAIDAALKPGGKAIVQVWNRLWIRGSILTPFC